MMTPEERQAEEAMVRQMVAEFKSNGEIAAAAGKSIVWAKNYLAKRGIKRATERPCKRCGKVFKRACGSQIHCPDCRKQLEREYQAEVARRKADRVVEPTEHICQNCGKTFYAKANRRYCSPECYHAAKPESKKHKMRCGRIDLEIRISGKTTERMEDMGWREARQIWHRGWLGGGYCALVYVDGARLDTVPKLANFFRYGGDAL